MAESESPSGSEQENAAHSIPSPSTPEPARSNSDHASNAPTASTAAPDASAVAPSSPSDPTPTWRGVAVATLATTALVTIASYIAPKDYSATAVGMLFLAATYFLVLRHSAAFIRAHGLGLGGLFEPRQLDPKAVAIDALRAVGLALVLFAIIAAPFAIGFKLYFHAKGAFDFATLKSLPKDMLGQLLVIALPEEAFFRGYLQTSLDALLPRKWRFLGADLSLALPIASLVFAVGHVLTRPDPSRLAVFFPALVFGYLRIRTKGIGTSLVFHAMCNLLSGALAEGWHLR